MTHTNNHKKSALSSGCIIAQNRKARHDYIIGEQLEAGINLEGWELKSLRAGRAQLKDSYVILKDQQAWLVGVHITPLSSASTHIEPEEKRSRKLLLHKTQLKQLTKQIQHKGYTAIALNLHWSRRYVKVQIALAKGKKNYDKRESLKQKTIDREQNRHLKRLS